MIVAEFIACQRTMFGVPHAIACRALAATSTTRTEARIKISTWIADFYNTTHRHSANDGLAPITFEHQMVEARRTSTAQLRAEVA